MSEMEILFFFSLNFPRTAKEQILHYLEFTRGTNVSKVKNIFDIQLPFLFGIIVIS